MEERSPLFQMATSLMDAGRSSAIRRVMYAMLLSLKVIGTAARVTDEKPDLCYAPSIAQGSSM